MSFLARKDVPKIECHAISFVFFLFFFHHCVLAPNDKRTVLSGVF